MAGPPKFAPPDGSLPVPAEPRQGESAPGPSATYWEVEGDISAEAEELWSLFLFEQGATGSQVLAEQENRLRVRYFFDQLPEGQVAAWAAEFGRTYPSAPGPKGLSARRKVREPWETAWREHFTPLPAGRNFMIRPPWPTGGMGEPETGERMPLVIDPGQGFGTGRHPSTALALEALEEAISHGPPPRRMLDVGTGSGILAIAARLLGVAEAWCVDIDGRVLPEVRRNFVLNGLSGEPRVVQGAPACLRGGFPLVVANIVTEVLIEEREALSAVTEPGGRLVLSGILTEEQSLVADAFAGEGFTRAAIHRHPLENWVALLMENTRQGQ